MDIMENTASHSQSVSRGFALDRDCVDNFQDYYHCNCLFPCFLLERFGLCYCKALQSDYITYIDDLLTSINAKPDLRAMLLTDPRLALSIFFGPCSPYHFRLTGPGKWEGARKAILTQWDRTVKVTKTRTVQETPSTFETLLKLFSFLALLVAVFFIFL